MRSRTEPAGHRCSLATCMRTSLWLSLCSYAHTSSTCDTSVLLSLLFWQPEVFGRKVSRLCKPKSSVWLWCTGMQWLDQSWTRPHTFDSSRSSLHEPAISSFHSGSSFCRHLHFAACCPRQATLNEESCWVAVKCSVLTFVSQWMTCWCHGQRKDYQLI